MKKRFISQLVVALIVMLLMTSLALPAFAADAVLVGVDAKFLYEDARSMLAMINEFRTGKDAWYIDTDNRTRVNVSGLKKLQYDYTLEKTAMLRAMEIAVLYSHTRPTGSSWNTSYPFPVGRYYMGENIAYGYGTAFRVFQAFREDNLDYVWQGHRRNMLHREFTRVGFGAVRVGNMIYWAQEFASGKPGGSASKMSAKSVRASWNMLRQSRTQIQPAASSLVILKGTSVEMPKVCLISDSGARNTLSGVSWKPAKTKIVKVKKSRLVGNKVGETTLKAKVGGVTLKMNVSVVASMPPPDTEIDDNDTPLGTGAPEYVYLEEGDECFFEPTGSADETEEPEEEPTEAPAENAGTEAEEGNGPEAEEEPGEETGPETEEEPGGEPAEETEQES